MNLKEKLADAQARFVECAEGIKAGDADVIAKAEGIKAEINSIKADIETAEKGAALLAAMGNDKPEQVKGEQPKTLGEFVAKNLDVASIKGRMGASVVTPEFKAAQWPNYGVSEVVNSRTVIGREVKTPIRDAFGAEQIDGNAYSWVVFGERTGGFGMVEEGAQKPEIGQQYVKVTRPLAKFAGWFKDSDELIEDSAYLASAVENRGIARLAMYGESYLATRIASVAVEGMTIDDVTIDSSAGFKVASGATAAQVADAIYACVASIKENTGFDADTVIVTSDVAMLLRTGKNGTSDYYGGGYFSQDSAATLPNVWGLRVIVDDGIGDALAVVGNFSQGATVITNRNGGIRVEATNANEDDFIHDLVTVRLEERALLAVREPAMFAAVTVQA